MMGSPISATSPAPPTLDAFEAVLDRHDSATLALEEWCRSRGLAASPRIAAKLVEGQDQAPVAEIEEALKLTPDERIVMRNVHLSCGAKVLSVAWNWYVPQRLTPQMNEQLRTTDIPFGKAVADVKFRRRTLSTVPGPAFNCPLETISTHRAMLMLPDGRPLAYLVECYTAANLAP